MSNIARVKFIVKLSLKQSKFTLIFIYKNNDSFYLLINKDNGIIQII